jgi:molybdate transport system substrate-binding protein
MDRRGIPSVLVLAAALAVPSTACGSGDGASGSITVAAAASLAEPLGVIAEAFERANPGRGDVTLTSGASSTLADQIEAGAPADVFASADETTMAEMARAGLLAGPPEVFARNRLAIVVKRGNPEGIDSLAELAAVDTVALCGREVPCGRYAGEALQRAGVAIPETSITRGRNARATFTAVAEGDAEAGVVYATDVTGEAAEAIAIPDAQNVTVTYPVAVTTTSRHRAAAEAFVAYLLSPEAQAVLVDAGFLPSD